MPSDAVMAVPLPPVGSVIDSVPKSSNWLGLPSAAAWYWKVNPVEVICTPKSVIEPAM